MGRKGRITSIEQGQINAEGIVSKVIRGNFAGGGEAAGIYQIKITLRGSKPPIWRRFLSPGDVKLGMLHDIIQDVMGWTDSHLHLFRTKDGRQYGIRDPEFGLDEDLVDEHKVTFSSIAGSKGVCVRYEYDFGDGWEHELKVENIVESDERYKGHPVCLEGERACPPEDCGGIGRYYNLLEIVRDPKHEEYQEMSEWIGETFDADAFDINEINDLLVRYRSKKK